MEKHSTNTINKAIRILMVGLLSFLVIGTNQVQAAPDAEKKTNEESIYKKCVKGKNELFGVWQGYKGGNSEGNKIIFTNKQMTFAKEGVKPLRATYRRVNKNTIEVTINGKTERTKATVKDNVLTIINTGSGGEIRFKRRTPSPGAKYLQCRMMGKWRNKVVTKDKIIRNDRNGKVYRERSYRVVDEKTIEVTSSDGSKDTHTVSFAYNDKLMKWETNWGQFDYFDRR